MSSISTIKAFTLSSWGAITAGMCGGIIHGGPTNIVGISVNLGNLPTAAYDGFFVTIITNAGTIALVSGIVTTIPANCITYLYYRDGVGFVVKSATIIATGNEVDPVFTASPAGNITEQNKTDWSVGYNHSQISHAPSNAQKNSDITKAEIEEKLTGSIDSHTHTGISVEETDPLFFGSPAGSITELDKQTWDAGYEHSQTTHAPVNAQKNSDILKSEIEDVLTGLIDSHTHSGGGSSNGLPSGGEAGAFLVKNSVTDFDAIWTLITLLQLGQTQSTAFRGDLGWDAYVHSNSIHAPSNAQRNSDITQIEIEAKLKGIVATHSHVNSLYKPMVNGDLANPELVFDDETGDIIMIEVSYM